MSAPQMKRAIDPRTIDEARANIAETIGRYLELKKEGAEQVACCPFHGERSPSFKVNERKGIFKCFGCGEHGDAIDFVMKIDGVSMPEAVTRIIGRAAAGPVSVIASPPRVQAAPKYQPVKKIPDSAEPPDFNHWRLGMPSKTWSYFDAEGDQVGYVCRFETTNKDGSAGKETLPLCWALNTETGEIGWRWNSFQAPRCLYNAHLLTEYPARPVLVVEGEKTADAAAALFTGFVVVTWPGGGNAVDMADFAPLHGRNVTLWGDWDAKAHKTGAQAGEPLAEREQPGTKAMGKVYAHLRGRVPSLRFVRPMAGAPDGWDLADAPPAEGFAALAWAKGNIVQAAEYFEQQPEAAPDAPAHELAANDNAPAADDGECFPEPLDIFGTRPPPVLPLDVLPACFRAYVSDQADLTGCDAGIIGLGAIVSAASCITDGLRLQPKRYDPTWTESARLWVAFVGDPSTKKSPAISKAVRHVKRLDHDLAEQNQAATAGFLRQQSDWKEAKKADRNLPTPEPKAPPIKRRLVEDITVEALTEVLKDNPAGVLVLKDELTGWFASMDAYKGGGKGASMDRAHWLEAYNGGRRSIDRVTRGPVVVPNWSVCIIGGIQPDMIRRIASSMGNDGLLQRFMIFCAHSAQEDADRVPNMRAIKEFSDLFNHIEQLPSSDISVTLTEDAQACRLRVAGYAKQLIGAVDHEHLKAWLGKWDGLYARLLMTYHVLACATAERPVFPTNEQVSGETAAQVERLMCAVLLPHAIHFYTEIMDAHDRTDNVRQLGKMILARNVQRLTTREIAIAWKASRKLEKPEIRAIVDSLVTMGWLMPDGTAMDSDGKPRAWWVNPAVHTAFKAQAEAEAERRRQVVATMRELKTQFG